MDTSKQSKSKKIIIRKFKPRCNGNTFNFDASWEVLQDSVLKIQKQQKASVTCEELYHLVENLCLNNHAGEICNRLQMLIREFAHSGYEKLVKSMHDASFHAFLQALNNLWEDFCNQMFMIRSIFLYMDKTYRVQPTTSLWEFSLEAFRMSVINNTQLKNRTVKGLLSIIEEERLGAQVDRQLLRSLLRMFMSLQIYDNVFEPEFLKATQRMYEQEARLKLQELEIPEYLKHVAKRIADEEERLDLYLNASTAKKLIGVVDACFLSSSVDAIINKGTDSLLINKKYVDLTLMYNLLSRVKNGLTSLKSAFTNYVKKIGRALISDVSRDKTLVQDLMDFKEDLDAIITICFKSNEKYVQAEKDAFDYFINTRPSRPAELIAKFMDSKLRTGNKECSEEELDIVMDKVILLFRFIQGKDVFEAFYKKDLAKRLLLGRSASVDAEKAMLSKLKNECGAGFTQKLEGMFKDMEISREFCLAFKQHLEATDRRGEFSKTEINVNILTMVHWPTYPIMEVNVPAQLSRLQDCCGKFYASKHNGRKLHWQYSLASAILKTTFKRNVTKELDVSLFQAMVLMMFDTQNQFTFEEILTETKIEEIELKRTLQSLACGKFRVLHKSPKGKDVAVEDTFAFNEDFNVNLYRIRISQVQMRETEEEHQQTEEQIFQDRQYQIDAAIVRIMKMRKNLSHTLLISELFSQLHFPTKPVDLKKRIESLIEREYMCRDKEDAQLYHYVA